MLKNEVKTPQNTTSAQSKAQLARIKKGEKKLLSPSEKVRQQLDSISRATLAGTGVENTANPIKVKKDSFRNKALRDNFYDVVPSTLATELQNLAQRAENSARNVQMSIENGQRQVKQNDEQRGKFVYELQMKYTAAIICLIFLFIGAPMGAIIQKGGFGYPILVAIGFFVLYIIGTIYCKNLKDNGEMTPINAAWLPVFFMLPIALVLTWRAVNDYKMSVDGTGKKLKILFETITKKLLKRPKTA